MTRWRWLKGRFIVWFCRHRNLSAVLGFLFVGAILIVPIFLFQPGFYPWFIEKIRPILEVILTVLLVFCVAVLTVGLFAIAIYNIFFKEDNRGH